MEKIFIKRSYIAGHFIAKKENKLGRILNSQFVPYLNNDIIEEKSDFESSLDWVEFNSVEEFINGYFFDIFDNDLFEVKIKKMKIKINQKEGILDFDNLETLHIIQKAVRLGFVFNDTQEIQNIKFAAEKYIDMIKHI